MLGALFKINHYPGADYMLIVGLGTEAIIFFFSAFEPAYTEPDWSLVYPELAGMYHDVEGGELKDRKSPAERLNDMLEKAKIDQKTIDKLGSGMATLSENASQLTDLTGAAVATKEFSTNVQAASNSAKQFGEAVAKDANATGEYAESLKGVSDSADTLTNAYSQAAQVLKGEMNTTEEFAQTVKQATSSAQTMANSYKRSSEILLKSVEALDLTSAEGDAYNEQLRRISENLAALNAIYEIQLQGTNKAVESTEKLQSSMASLLEKLEQSSSSTSDFTDQMSTLSQRMSALNRVYGNMLTAMNVNG
jgi:methyl-accepting chemotaxis protein